ncbi:hypothetical protein MARLIPOL_06144 [Marinobacter lipolyticus SM19]|uniref:Uncharacterized protein n=1 Tax=Marinobacter lipolyticus SM19 TaxID=1318628 RepID=R8B399_9GAMM|nr:hypothetical protein MARLIPOL_06144 [Marinobacter lipolyticus SM19]
MLERPNGRVRPSSDDQPWQMYVDRAMGIVHSLPDKVELRQRRRDRGHPVINMRTDEVSAKRVQLPTIILEPSDRIK